MSSLPPPPGYGQPSPSRWWSSGWAIAVMVVVGLTFILLMLAALAALLTHDEPTAVDNPESTAIPTVEPTPEEAPEGEPEEDPEPEPTADPLEVERFAFIEAFNSTRLDVAAELEGNVVEIDTVDRFVLDEETDSIVVAASSIFSTEEYHEDGAWTAARYLAKFYDGLEHYEPAVDLHLESARYVCPGATMKRLQDRQLDREDWRAACQP